MPTSLLEQAPEEILTVLRRHMGRKGKAWLQTRWADGNPQA